MKIVIFSRKIKIIFNDMGYTIDYAEFKDSSISASKLPEGETEHITTGSYACNVNFNVSEGMPFSYPLGSLF